MRAIKYNPGLLSLPLEARSEESRPTVKEKDKGFWDGGTPGHGTNKESSGRPSGYPGHRRPRREGVHVDLEYPAMGGGAGPRDDKPIRSATTAVEKRP